MARATLAERRDRFVHSRRWKLVIISYFAQNEEHVRYLHPEDADVWRIPFKFSFWVHGHAYVFPTVLGWESSLYASALREGVIFGSIVHDTDAEAKGSVFDALYGDDPVGLRRIEALAAREQKRCS